MDISVLDTAPGVDTDRRILRLAFFAELSWNHLLQSGVLDKEKTQASGVTEKVEGENIQVKDYLVEFLDTEATQGTILKLNMTVCVYGLNEKDHVPVTVVNGMEGKIVEVLNNNHCCILFTNLNVPQTIPTANLKQVESAGREVHKCTCGKDGTLFCKRCNMMWYCSSACQKNDYERHKIACKAMVSEFGLMSLMHSDILAPDPPEKEESDYESDNE